MEYFKSTVETSSDSSEDDLEGKEIIKPKPKNKVFHSRANIYDHTFRNWI